MMLATKAPEVRRAAIYLRVSSDDQAERGTIASQAFEVRRRLASEPTIEIADEYRDDGVSGTLALGARPAGAKLLADAKRGAFDEVWVYRLDRLGRDLIELAIARRSLVEMGIRLISAQEGEPDEFMFDITSAVSANERRVFLRRTASGMLDAARQGRYCGGIVPLGFKVEGAKEKAFLVPDETVLWADRSAADLVRDIYERIALRGESCRMVARDLNALGIPTHYVRDGREIKRGLRVGRTQGIWRSGRIRNLVVNPVYRGELQYGRRIDKRSKNTERRGHEIISAPIEGVVSPALWQAAQDALAANRRVAKNTYRVYLLKGAMTCGVCGLTYVGSWSKDIGWYRCGGQLVERGPVPGRCLGTSLRNDAIEPPVWNDIEAWLRSPGDVLDALDGTNERAAQGAIAEAEAITLARALKSLDEQKARVVKSVRMGLLSDAEVKAELGEIGNQRATLEARVAAAQAPQAEVVPQEVHALLAEVRARLDAGLTDAQRQEIVRLLASVVVHTTIGEDGTKTAKALVTYRFPGVVPTCTGTGSWQRSDASE